MSRKKLVNFNPESIIHPDDAAVISKVNKIPGFKHILKKTIGNYTEYLTKITYTGNGYDITESSYPSIFKQLDEDCRILGLKEIPLLTTSWEYFISSRTVGGDTNRIVITSGSIDLLTPQELDFLLGHEIGHILCGHLPYHMLVEAMYMPILSDNSIINPLTPIKLLMLEWYRISHYSADRVGLLACQDIDVALSTMVKMSGLPKKYFNSIDIKAFIRQANDFSDNHSNALDKVAKTVSIMSANAPWMVLRAKKLLEFYESDEYSAIIKNS